MFSAINAAWFRQREKLVAAAIVLLAILHGIIYVNTVPPWQHYDEPTHFEYAWMIVNKDGLPEEGVYDWDFRADLVRSMVEHDFYAGMPGVPNPDTLDPSHPPAGLTYPQLDDPPLYYLFVSLPMRMMTDADLASQLVAARMMSVLLLGVTVLAGWGVVRTVTPEGSILRFLVPLTMAMLPGFVELMTAVNNDVGAAAVFSLFLWGAVRIIRRGVNPADIALVLVTALAAIYTKSTAYIAVPLAMVALILGILPGQLRRYAWLVVGVGVLVLSIGLLYLQEPAFWYRATSQSGPIRTERSDAPLGDYALVLDPGADITPRWLRAINQPITPADLQRVHGRRLTLGFFMWFDADDPALTEYQARSPAVNVDFSEDETTFQVDLILARSPQFYVLDVDVPQGANRLWVSMSQPASKIPEGLRIYFDGLVLAEGAYIPGTLPVFDDDQASGGVWADTPFRNLLRNGSAEKSWLAFRPWADDFSARILPSNVRLSILLYTLFDRDGASWYYVQTARNTFQTFWGRFGWGHVPLPGSPGIYGLFGFLTFLAVLGVVFFPFGRGSKLPVDSLLFLGLALIGVWVAAFARGAIFIFVQRVFLPSARYGFPAIIPSVLALVAGWYAAAVYLKRWFRIPNFYFIFLYVDFLLFYSVIALWGIGNFYA